MAEDPTLKDYIDEKFRLAERALDIAAAALNYRLEEMNKLHALIITERSNFLSKDTYESRHRSLEERLNAAGNALDIRLEVLERWQAKILGALGILIILIPLMTGVLIFLLTRHL